MPVEEEEWRERERGVEKRSGAEDVGEDRLYTRAGRMVAVR